MSPTTTTSRATVLVPPEAYAELYRLREDFDSIMESIELDNDPEVMASLRRAEEDMEAGRVVELEEYLGCRKRQ